MTKKTHDVEGLMSAFGLLLRRLRAEAGSHELSWSERLVIGRLARSAPMTTADLARAEGMKPQSMGTTVAGLEARGLVRREPHPTDGRQSLLGLTTEGSALRGAIRDAKQAWLEKAIDELEPHDRETLLAAVSVIARMVEP